MENKTITTAQLKSILKNVDSLLSFIKVGGDDVFHLSECRKALRQIENMEIVIADEIIEEEI